jgi:hypothetical protein
MVAWMVGAEWRCRSARADVTVVSPNTDHFNGAVSCGFDGEALCHMEERRVQEDETCGEVEKTSVSISRQVSSDMRLGGLVARTALWRTYSGS